MNNLCKNFYSLFLGSILFTATAVADNEIYVTQSGATSSIDLEQLGSSNLIGGLNSTSGSLTAFDLDGTTMTLDINQIGSSNTFLGDIYADTITGFFEFSGDSNAFTIQIDPENTYGADNSNWNVQVTGDSNTFTLNQAINDLASSADLDWLIQGSNNTITYDLDIASATSYLDIDGDDNTLTYDGDGYSGGYFYLDHTGGSRTFNITQQSTLAVDWLKIISNGSNGTICINQSDGGTSTSC